MKRLLVNLTLLCLLGLANTFAQTLAPQDGKSYRIKNVRSGKYLTMTAGNTSTVSLEELQNNEYQFWVLAENTTNLHNNASTFSIRNVGFKNNGDKKAYIGSSGTGNNASVGAYTSTANNGWYGFVDATNKYSIVTKGTKVGLCSNAAGTSVLLYDQNDAGAYWVLEDAVIVTPEIVTLKSGRKSTYIYESAGKLLQTSTVTETAKWIKYPTNGGVMLINNSTHNIIQGVAKNAAAVTGTDHTVFGTTTDGTYYGFYTRQGNDDVYLNERNGNDICGWTNGLSDAGNKWLVNKVGDITEEEVLEILKGASPYATKIEDGKLYRLYNETRDSYVFEKYLEGTVNGAALSETDYTQVWKAVVSGSNVKWENLVTGKCIVSGGSQSQIATTGTGSTYAFSIRKAISDINSYFNFTYGGFALHMDSSNRLVNWYTGSGSVDASDWLLCNVDESAIKSTVLDKQKTAYAEYVQAKEEFDTMKANMTQYEKTLGTLFEDKACTTLTADAKAMSDDEFATAIAELPQFLQDMCLKIRNDSWTLSKAGNNWEKFFRIADYHVYSKANDMCWKVGMSYPMSRLSNPTGISGDAGTVFAIFLNEACPSNATLKVEFTDGGEKDNPRTGDQYDLKKGMNMFMLTKSKDIFIYYEVNSAEDSKTYYLEKFKNLKIHIEGGVCNGYFDLTRDMKDADWADMVKSGMLTHGRVFLKGSHVVGNWPSSILLDLNPNKIEDIANFYNNIPKWEQEIMGIDNEHMPNIEQRYNNVWTALGTDLGSSYMYATSFGTYYNWGTLSTILSPNVLSNGGNQWGPAHEFGHDHQSLFNMVGCTEVSNNVFSNAVVYKMGASMSRGVALSELIPAYAANKSWMDLGIWCKTQMYWKLYQYFHIAGHDPNFYPKLFNVMRKNGLKHQNGQLVPASTDYLRFAEACCEAADADLSEFFQMYGFFNPLTTDTEKDGTAARFIDDYSTYYLYATQAMINATLKRCHAFTKKIKNIGFIDDRIRATPATYPGAPEGKMRTGLNGGGDNSIGTEGTVGMYLDYMTENYVQADSYKTKTYRMSASGSSKILKVEIDKKSGVGAMGFKIFDSNDNLLYFYNDFSFTVPGDVYKRINYSIDDIVLIAADALGNDYVIEQGANYTGSYGKKLDAIDNVKSATAQPGAIYDLSGRRVTTDSHGLFIINGKKVVK